MACNLSLRVFGSQRAQIAVAADDTTTQMLFKASSVRTRSPCVFLLVCSSNYNVVQFLKVFIGLMLI